MEFPSNGLCHTSKKKLLECFRNLVAFVAEQDAIVTVECHDCVSLYTPHSNPMCKRLERRQQNNRTLKSYTSN